MVLPGDDNPRTYLTFNYLSVGLNSRPVLQGTPCSEEDAHTVETTILALPRHDREHRQVRYSPQLTHLQAVTQTRGKVPGYLQPQETQSRPRQGTSQATYIRYRKTSWDTTRCLSSSIIRRKGPTCFPVTTYLQVLLNLVLERDHVARWSHGLRWQPERGLLEPRSTFITTLLPSMAIPCRQRNRMLKVKKRRTRRHDGSQRCLPT